jgi:hypothetical protein
MGLFILIPTFVSAVFNIFKYSLFSFSKPSIAPISPRAVGGGIIEKETGELVAQNT